MSGLTMVVPRGLGLVAALAVSGTALYLVYGYNKKKAFVNIRRGKGSLRLEYQHPNAIQQKKQQQQQKESGGVCLELLEGKQIGIVEIHCHHLPCLRRATRRQQQQQQQQQQLTGVAADAGAPLARGNLERQASLKERLEKCEADAALVKALHNTLASYTVGDQQQQQPGEPLRNCSTAVSSPVQISKAPARDSLLLPVSSSSSAGDDRCSKGLLLSTAAPSSSSSSTSSSSSRSYAVVGCFVSSGTRKAAAGKQKKVVRFSPSVAEPSSNNHDYRRRFKTQIAANRAQRTHVQSSEAAIRSIAYDRPRLYSQAAKQTITYNIHRSDHRYCGRSY